MCTASHAVAETNKQFFSIIHLPNVAITISMNTTSRPN